MGEQVVFQLSNFMQVKKLKTFIGSLLKKSSEAGNTSGMAIFAYWLKLHYPGKNAAFMSIDWAKKALNSNNSFAIAYCHYQGLGTFQDTDKAKNLFLEASMEGDMHAQFFLGNCFMHGRGVSKDSKEALYWYWKSAEQGFCRAQYTLAQMYRKGVGCEASEQLADFWFKKAANQGFVK